MSVQELAQPERRAGIHIPIEQEARNNIAHVTQQLLDLHFQEGVSSTPGLHIIHGTTTDHRFTEVQKSEQIYVPEEMTYISDRMGITSMLLKQTPISISLNITNTVYPVFLITWMGTTLIIKREPLFFVGWTDDHEKQHHPTSVLSKRPMVL